MVGGASIGRGCRYFQVGFTAAPVSDFRLWRSGPGRRALELSSSLIPRIVSRNHGDIGCSTRSQGSGNCRRVRPSPRIETGDACWQPGQKSRRCSFSVPVRQTPQQGQLNSMNQTCVKPDPAHLRTSGQSTALGDRQVLKSREVENHPFALATLRDLLFPHRCGLDVTHSSTIFSIRSLGAVSFVSTAMLNSIRRLRGAPSGTVHSFTRSG